MHKHIYLILALVTTSLIYSCKTEVKEKSSSNETSSILDYVDPFIGTADHGHVYPGATVPFGMVQLSPDNGTAGWDWCSGYNWIDSVIVGFSHTHLSGTGIGDLLDISIMPTIREIDFSQQVEPRASSYASSFDHDNEQASPGYYSVQLDNKIKVELTAGKRFGFHQYNFPDNSEPTILLDLGFAINWDKPTKTYIEIVDDTHVNGYRYSTGWAKDQRVFFAMEFSKPFTYIAADSTSIKTNKKTEGTKLRSQFKFKENNIALKVALSTASIKGAEKALQEINSWDFDTHKNNAAKAWEKELAKITVKSDDETLKKVFYTSLYRTCLAPTLLEDALGEYKGADGKIHSSDGYTRYGLFSLWDTFRACNPLHTITQADKVNDFIASMIAHYDEYGLLPVWDLLANETNTMTGYHAVPVIVDAYLKGFKNYDVEKAYEAMKKSSMQNIRATDLFRQHEYIPHDKAGQSVTRTLEYAYDDWCIAQMAKALGHEEDYLTYMKKAAYYENLFDPSTGFMRAKLEDGSWKTPFDPQYSSHDFDVAEYTEGNAWQHSWFVPHDVEKLIQLHGGKEKFVNKLDKLFSADSEIKGDFASADISGLIGQYAHGNEPSHHIAYMYNYADRYDRTQDRVRNILQSQYNDTPHGLCGNEDCGQMSAWYVMSAMGLYPMNPASGNYDLGISMFDELKIHLDNGNIFTITSDQAKENATAVSLNGKDLEKLKISHEDIVKGGTLKFYKK
jgi:predicted alpha-1,2-mannosidase